MRRFQNILCILTDVVADDRVLIRAKKLAAMNNAKLTLLDVLDLDEGRVSDSTTQSAIQELNVIQTDARQKELEKLADGVRADHPALDASVYVASGDLATVAIREVVANGYDLVMKAPEGGTGALKVLFGSSDQKLIRKCPCPVWIIKPSESDRFKRILAAVNPSPGVPESESLARLIMALSTSLAADERCELHVLHVWRLAGEAKLRGRQINIQRVEEILLDMENAHKSELERLVKDFSNERRTVHLVKGHPGEVIPAFVEKHDVDLVVIGSIGRSGIPGLLIGNTAERVLNAVDCSVLTLKPEGFETPIDVTPRD